MFVKLLIELLVELWKGGIIFDSELYFFLLVYDAHGKTLDTSDVNVVRYVKFPTFETLGM